MIFAFVEKTEKPSDSSGASFYDALFYMFLNDWIWMFSRSDYYEIA